MNKKSERDSVPRDIKAVLFDFDGTLTEPGAIDFSAIRRAVGCPGGQAALEFIKSLPAVPIGDQLGRKDALKMLENFEMEAASDSKPGKGAEKAAVFLVSKGIKTGIVSRNSLTSIKKAFENFNKIVLSDFDVVISRDSPVRPKPDPEGIFLAAERLEIATKNIVMVGDYIFDIEAGERAGAITVFLDNRPEGEKTAFPGGLKSDFTISGLEELRGIIG